MTMAIIFNICAKSSIAATYKAVFCVVLKRVIKQYPGERPLLLMRIEIRTVNQSGFKTFGVIETETNSGQHTVWKVELQEIRVVYQGDFNNNCFYMIN